MKTLSPQPSNLSPGPLHVDIQSLAVRMRRDFSSVLQDVADVNVRPAALGRLLKIDKTLSARLLRSIRADNPLSTAREAPAPQGLRLFLDAAARAGATQKKIAGGQAVIQDFVKLLDSMPLGRSSFDAAIDGWLPDSGARVQRTAQQALFKATAQMLGYSIELSACTYIIQPSASGKTCDTINILLKEGLCRLRAGLPIMLFSSFMAPLDSPELRAGLRPKYAFETLDGEREVTDPRKFLLADVGAGRSLPMRLIESGSMTRFVLEGNSPPVNVRVTSAMANLNRDGYLRYREGEKTSAALFTLPRVPARVLVLDLLLHPDVYPNYQPIIVPRLHGTNLDAGNRSHELLEVDRVDMALDINRLGTGLDRIGLKEFAGYAPMVQNAFDRAGWDPKRFRVFRCRVQYPMPFVSLTTWLDLPEDPEDQMNRTS